MNKRIISWCLYDFANSSYSAVIASVIFPVYYVNTVVGNTGGEGDLWWGRAISLSMIVVAISAPFLGGISDYAKVRKKMFLLFTFLCLCSVSSLYFIKESMVLEGFLLIVLANIGLEGGLIFYNSYLPDIVSPSHHGRVSAWGYGIGYGGSIISLLLALYLVNEGHIRLAWPMVALFFGIFSLPAFLFLPPDERQKVSILKAATEGFKITIRRLRRVWEDKHQRRFLIAYFLFEDGVNTVIIFSSIYAATTLNFKSEELILMYIIVQLTALIGAFLMAKPIDYMGPKRVVVISLILWIVVTFSAFFVYKKIYFLLIASIAGLGLGTIQASSRAFYIQFIPKGQESEYFGLYSLVGKSSAIIGPLIFGYISSTFKSQRPAVLSIAIFFLAGLYVIKKVRGGSPNVAN